MSVLNTPIRSLLSRVRAVMGLVFLALAILQSGYALAEPLKVVASFSILGDLAQQVGGERISVHTLVGPDADAHVFQPTPADAKTIAQAHVVIVNGLGFEGWITRLVKSSGYRGALIVASKGVKAIKSSEAAHDEHDDHKKEAHHHGDLDPHAWQDLSNALRYVDNIAQALSAADPEGKSVYLANSTRYKQEISALDGELKRGFKAIAQSKRKVVTTHDAFGYFAHAYGIAFLSPVGINTEAEASAADIARLIKQIRREKIPAVFMENIADPRLIERIRQESGARIGGRLFSDALSPVGGPAPTYLDMMRQNAKALTTALASE